MAGGAASVGEYFDLENCDKQQFEELEKDRLIWKSFGKGIELMKLDLFNLKRRSCNDEQVLKEIQNIDLDIYNLEKDLQTEYSYLHYIKLYLEIADKLIWVHVHMNNVRL